MKKRLGICSLLLCTLLTGLLLLCTTMQAEAAVGRIDVDSILYALFDKSGSNWKWDAGDKTLYLYDGLSISTTSDCIQVRSGATISVSGTVSMTATSGTALYLDNCSLSMNGGSTLKITATSNGIEGGNISLSAGTYNISAGGAGIYATGNVNIGSSVTATFSGSGRAINATSGSVTVAGSLTSTSTTGGILASKSTVEVSSSGTVNISATGSSSVGIQASGGMYLYGSVTSKTLGNSLYVSTSGAPFVATGAVTATSSQAYPIYSNGTVSLQNATLSGKNHGVYAKSSLTVSGYANQSVSVTSSGGSALYCDGAITISHPAVTLSGSSSGYGVYAGGTLTAYSGAKVTVTSGNGFRSGSTLSVSDSTLISTGYSAQGLYGLNNVVISNSTLQFSSVGTYGIYAGSTMDVTKSNLTVTKATGTAIQSMGNLTISESTVNLGTISGNGIQASGSLSLLVGSKATVSEVKGIALVSGSDMLLTGASQLTVSSGQGSGMQSQGLMTITGAAKVQMGTLGGNGLQSALDMSLDLGAQVTVTSAGGYGINVLSGTLTISPTSAFTAGGAGETAVRCTGLLTIDGTVTLTNIAGMGIQSTGSGMLLDGKVSVTSKGIGIQTAQAITLSENCQLTVDSQSKGIVTAGDLTFVNDLSTTSSITAVGDAITTSGKFTLGQPSNLAISTQAVGIHAGGDVTLGLEGGTSASSITIESKGYSIQSDTGHVFLYPSDTYYYFGGGVSVDATAGKTYSVLDGATLFFGMDSGSGIGVSRTDFTLTADMTPERLVLRSLQVGKNYTFTVAAGASLKVGTVSLASGARFIIEEGADVIFNGPSGDFEGEVTTSIPATLDFSTTESIVTARTTYSSFSSSFDYDESTSTLTLTDAVIDVSSGSALSLSDGTTLVLEGDCLISTLSSTDPVISCDGDLTIEGDGLTVSGGSSSIEVEGDLTLSSASLTLQGASEAALVAENLTSTGSTIEAFGDASVLAVSGSVSIDNLSDDVTVETIDGVTVLTVDGEIATILDIVGDTASEDAVTTTVVTDEDGTTTTTATNETTGEVVETTQSTDGTTTTVITDPDSETTTTITEYPDGTVTVEQDYTGTATVDAVSDLEGLDLSLYLSTEDEDGDDSQGDGTGTEGEDGQETGDDQGDGTGTGTEGEDGQDTGDSQGDGTGSGSEGEEGQDTGDSQGDGTGSDTEGEDGQDTGDGTGSGIEGEDSQTDDSFSSLTLDDLSQGLGEEGRFLTGTITLAEGATFATVSLSLADLGFDLDSLAAGGSGIVPVQILEDGSTKILTFSDIIDGNLMIRVTEDVTFTLVDNTTLFSDVGEADWYFAPVTHAASREILKGVGDDLFDPNGTTTCGMAITILYRLMGSPAVEIPTDNELFADLDWTAYYGNATAWGLEQGIIDGTLDGFQPEAALSRQQLTTMLYYTANLLEYSTSASTPIGDYSDSQDVADWASGSLRWAVASSLMEGRTEDALDPEGTATRGEMATLLQRFIDWGLLLEN